MAHMLSAALINKLTTQKILLADITNNELVEFCKLANSSYRSGSPIISDADYDFVYLKELKKRLPSHTLLTKVEPEIESFSTEKITLPEIMLSMDKGYGWEDISKWIERLHKAAIEINLNLADISIKATPKLDGFAGYDDGLRLYTRGDGKKGSDISRVFARGLCIYNDSERAQGAGEIVVKKSYFATHLANNFEYPRNFQASLIKEKELDELAKKAIADGAALFVPFAQLPNWNGNIADLTTNFDNIVNQVLAMVDFDMDGIVFETTNQDLKQHMGANRKFHRWQIALKENKDKAQVKVVAVAPQVGRTGKITPVAQLEPTLLSGATIVRATGHNYGLVKEQGLGAGSVIELTRSGLVIPKINKVIKSVAAELPNNCPSCDFELIWEADFLICTNHDKCPAQIIANLEYFFKILANNDGFGIATIKKLYQNNITKISQIYQLNQDEFITMGFGEKTSANLMSQLKRSSQESIEDWRFLAAFGVNRMGMGNCENLLKNYLLTDIFTLDVEKIAAIDGFAELSAKLAFNGLKSIENEFNLICSYGFNLEKTAIKSDLSSVSHALLNKKIVFSGKMQNSRGAMTKHAKNIGIKVIASVNSSTDFLVAGESVGSKKISNAKKFNVEVITEKHYLDLINN